jgi:lysozyme
MTINEAGLNLLKRFEGLRLRAYRCPAGVWTIGYGHTGAEVMEGLSIGQEQAEALLRADLRVFEAGLSRALGGAVTTPNQFSALVCLAYNIGLGACRASSVLRYHRNGKPHAAAQSFLLWNKAGGRVLPGLTRRRREEAELYARTD